jgi:hypothetical protein
MTPTQISPRHAAARQLASAGIGVFPCRVGAKGPATANGFEAATTDLAQIDRWWAMSDFNIGVVPANAGLCVIDADLHKGVDANEINALPPTRRHLTPSGGHHYIYASREQFGNYKLARNIDVRSANGYVLWPPSVVGGVEYSIDPTSAALAHLPDAVAKRLAGKREAAERVTVVDDGENAMPLEAATYCMGLAFNDKHPGRYQLAAALVRNFGLSDATATELCETYGLRTWPNTSGTPWLAVLKHARKYGQGELGGGPAREDPRAGLPPFDPACLVKPEHKLMAPAAVTDEDLMQKLTLSSWLARDIPATDWLLGGIIATDTKTLGYAPTGLGKTNFFMALAAHMATGKDFLNWRVPRSSCWLYVDGEMPQGLAKERIADLTRRLGFAPDNLLYFNRDDFPGLEPLNTPAGAAFIEDIVAQIEATAGKLDGIVFDNTQALLVGNMAEEEPWAPMIAFNERLNRRLISVVWIHHTGHDVGHAYGTKTREWKFDTVMALRPAEDPIADISFSLDFNDKHRRRLSSSRADYQPARVSLANDQWSINTVPSDRGLADLRNNLDEIVVAVTEIARYGRTLSRRPFVLPAGDIDTQKFAPIKRLGTRGKMKLTIKPMVKRAIEDAASAKVTEDMIQEALDRMEQAGRLFYRTSDRRTRGQGAGYDLPEASPKATAGAALSDKDLVRARREMYAMAQKLDETPEMAQKLDDWPQRVHEVEREFGVSDSGYFDDVLAEHRITLHKLYVEEARRMLAESRKVPRA